MFLLKHLAKFNITYMGNAQTIPKVNFENVQKITKSNVQYLLINTLNNQTQSCLIENTLNINDEETKINFFLQYNKEIKIILYGSNCNDETVIHKYLQLYKLGFVNVFVYLGGLFEWLLLQDIYGDELFPTTSKELDLLKYKGNRIEIGF